MENKEIFEKGIALLDTRWERIKITLDIIIGFPIN